MALPDVFKFRIWILNDYAVLEIDRCDLCLPAALRGRASPIGPMSAVSGPQLHHSMPNAAM